MSPPRSSEPSAPHPVTNATLMSLSSHNSFELLDAQESDLVVKVKDGRRTRSKTDPLIGGTLPSHCSREEKEKLTLALSTILEILVVYGFRIEKYDTAPTLKHWQLCSAQCGWMKFLKYKISAFFSDYLGTELPPSPFSVPDHARHLIGGRAGRFIYKLMKHDSEALRTEFKTTILYSKKGMPRAGEGQLDAQKASTKKVLTTKRPVPVSAQRQALSPDELWTSADLTKVWDLERNKLEARRTVREIFRGHLLNFDKHCRKKVLAPSVKASYVNSRARLGPYGELIALRLVRDQVDGSLYAQLPRHHLSQDPFQKVFSEAWELVRSGGGEEIEEEDVEFWRLRPGFKERQTELYSELYDAVLRLAMDEKADVSLVALPEALKIRVISKGPALTYFVLKPIQKFLHKIMRKQRMFALIGETVTSKFLDEVLLGHPGLFHSLDYSSATDFLNPEISSAIVEEICDVCGFPDDLRTLFHKALTGHTVEGEEQVWGQLMGSVVSFIVLCIANAAVIRSAFEQCMGVEASLETIPAVVNGDDGAVKAPAEFLPIWKDIAAVSGLEPSQGKVYSHATYLNINSTSFTLQGDHLEHVPYVNMGLVMGMTRSGGSKKSVEEVADATDRFGSLGSRHHQLMETCPPRLRLPVHKLFVKNHWDLLKSVRLPWFVPEELGGVGLKPFKVWSFGENVEDASWSYLEVDGVRYGPSDQDQEIMELLRSKTYRSVSTRKLPTSQPIQVRSTWYARSGLPRAHVRGRPDLDVRVDDGDIAFMDAASYYIAPSLVEQKLESRSTEILRSNERAWSYLSKVTSQGVSLV